MKTAISEENVRIPCAGQTISGVLTYPEEARPCAGVLLCSPHPNFAGNMENNVIVALARTLGHVALTLRFDYRGIGSSGIQLAGGESVYDFWNRVEETKDYAAPLEDTREAFEYLARCAGDVPLHIAGYSFGSITGLIQLQADERLVSGLGIAPPLTQYGFDFLRHSNKPRKLLSGTDDFVFSQDVWSGLQRSCPSSVSFETFSGHDHFFRGDEAMLCRRAAQFFNMPVDDEGANR